MAHELVSTLLRWFETLSPAFTKPGFANALILFLGWIEICGFHAVTAALVASGVAGRRHHEAFHRFFSRGTWHPDTVGRLLFVSILKLLPADAVIEVVVDDTLTKKHGPEIFGLGTHLDPVSSTRRHSVLSFGHVWVVVSVVVRVPFSSRQWSLPVLFRLYRTQKDNKRHRRRHRSKPELAREMLEMLLGWVGDRRVRVTMDGAYANKPVLRGLTEKLTAVGALHPRAALTALPEDTRHRRKYGDALPRPQELAEDRSCRWKRCTVFLYGRERVVRYKTILAQWATACGPQLLRVVVVKTDERDRKSVRAYFSTDPTMSVEELLENYAVRWSIEVCFRDLKQELGFGQSPARKQAAVERTAPFVGHVYTVLVLWYAEGTYRSPLAQPPLRPWYPHKKGHSFADIVRCAQRILPEIDVLDPLGSLEQLRCRSELQTEEVPSHARLAA
jgi:hypothetical protein